ncbi:hypothetical protein LB505_009458 [Fusarium chuoi]|nr:hypothetical protein LB505_009458 [Fusarium chuoi]
MEYPLAFQTAFAAILEKQPKREPFRFIHLSGKWVVQEQDAKLWVNDYPRKLKGLYEIRSLEVAKEHAEVWKAWMLRPGGVITQRMRVPGYLAQVLLGDDYVIKNEELGAFFTYLAVEGSEKDEFVILNRRIVEGGREYLRNMDSMIRN